MYVKKLKVKSNAKQTIYGKSLAPNMFRILGLIGLSELCLLHIMSTNVIFLLVDDVFHRVQYI